MAYESQSEARLGCSLADAGQDARSSTDSEQNDVIGVQQHFVHRLDKGSVSAEQGRRHCRIGYINTDSGRPLRRRTQNESGFRLRRRCDTQTAIQRGKLNAGHILIEGHVGPFQKSVVWVIQQPAA